MLPPGLISKQSGIYTSSFDLVTQLVGPSKWYNSCPPLSMARHLCHLGKRELYFLPTQPSTLRIMPACPFKPKIIDGFSKYGVENVLSLWILDRHNYG